MKIHGKTKSKNHPREGRKILKIAFLIVMGQNGNKELLWKLADPEMESLFVVGVMDTTAMFILLWPKREKNMPNLNSIWFSLGPNCVKNCQ